MLFSAISLKCIKVRRLLPIVDLKCIKIRRLLLIVVLKCIKIRRLLPIVVLKYIKIRRLFPIVVLKCIKIGRLSIKIGLNCFVNSLMQFLQYLLGSKLPFCVLNFIIFFHPQNLISHKQCKRNILMEKLTWL